MDRKTGIVTEMFAVAVLATASGCATGDGVSGGEHVGSVQGAITVPDAVNLPICEGLRRGAVFFIQSQNALVYCDGGTYRPVDLHGLDGKDGVSYVVTTSAATLDQCPTGGVVLQVGPDANKDGVVDSVASSAVLCNGARGPEGPQGPSGDRGENGRSSLVRQTPEPAGPNCPTGGTRVDTGVDDNGNGELDDAEIAQTTYVCSVAASAVCDPGFHVCGGSGGALSCVDSSSTLTCGTRCSPCPDSATAFATCNPDGTCGLHECDPGYRPSGGACVLACNGSNWKSFTDRTDCDLQHASFSGSLLDHVNFAGANLTDANFFGASLANANLSGANLSGANFQDADLSGADLRGANVTGAHFHAADLLSANLTGTLIAGLDFRDVYLVNAKLSLPEVAPPLTDDLTVCPSGKVGPCW
jgi:hypothetical protein